MVFSIKLDDNRKHLKIKGDDVKSIPIWIESIKELEKLTIKYSDIEFLPEGIFRLPNIKIIEIVDNNTDIVIPELTTSYTSSLEELKIIHSLVEKIPRSIGKLSNLTKLDLESNNIETIPESLWDLSKLTYLNLGTNQINNISGSIGKLLNLTYLNLSGNEFEHLPESIVHLQKLTEFMINFGILSDLPDSIGNLSNLERLYISGTNLTELPQSIGDLLNLEILDINYSNLKSLPESIGNLSSLKFLDIRHNRLHYLPISIIKILNNIELYLDEDVLKSYGLIQDFEDTDIVTDEIKNQLIEKIKDTKGKKRKTNNVNYNDEEFGPSKVKFQKIEAKYFDSIKNRHISSDVGQIKNSLNKKCYYCKNKPIEFLRLFNNNEAHLVCSKRCSDKNFIV
jgi:Leucine-rich repeat (LRR) protein